MWEITLLGKSRDLEYFLSLKDYLKMTYKNDIIMVISFDRDLVCSIALANENFLLEVKKKIFETIIKIVKTEYYVSELEIFTKDKSLNAFILSSLVFMNLSDEVNYAMQIVDLINQINVRSFIYFKVHKIIDLWHQECEYYNMNFKDSNNDQLYLEFLRFLANNSNSKQDIMYIEQNNKKMFFLDKHKRKILSLNKNDEIDLIVQLVMISPKKIIINCLDCLSNKVANLISYIFEGRVSMLL